jgi:hypothetical protein
MACVDVGAWYEKHQHDEDLKTKPGDGGAVVFDAHVCAIFRTCLDRQVPALAEPCDGSGSETAFSRVVETIELKLVPGLAAETAWEQPYRRLRLLFGLVDARPGNQEDADLLSRRDAIANSPAADQPKELLALFRELAASDVLDMEPPATPQGEQMSILPER